MAHDGTAPRADTERLEHLSDHPRCASGSPFIESESVMRLARLFAVAAFALLTVACDGAFEPDHERPIDDRDCGGERWCEIDKACHMADPALDVVGHDLGLEWGLQGGSHIDVPLQLAGFSNGDHLVIYFEADGRRFETWEQSYFSPDSDDCSGVVRWMADYDMEDAIYSGNDGGTYTMVVEADTWGGRVEQRARVTITAR